ncbi:MAG TPA: hypothetical protein VGA98_07540 [Allosphingosinicella sp.]|jgi:hypothetical protein
MIDDRFNPVRQGADALEEGYYLIQRWRTERVPIPVRIWYGPPLDPETGEEMDRSWRWQIYVGGIPLEDEPIVVGGMRIDDLTRIWPACARERIDAAEYAHRIERAEWAAAYDPNDPYGTASGRIDPLTVSLPPV